LAVSSASSRATRLISFSLPITADTVAVEFITEAKLARYPILADTELTELTPASP
jgi:hypothetical protein